MGITKEDLIAYAPTEDVELYPDSDGKPFSDLHRRILTRTIPRRIFPRQTGSLCLRRQM